MRKTTQLRKLLEGPELLLMPGAFDAISARIIERAGFKAIQCSGFGISTSYLGLPDYSFLGMADMVAASARIANAVDVPVMADGDTGFGNAVNAFYAVREFERAGCAGVNIEDQVMPKRCGHLDGKVLIPIDEAVAKIRACADARVDKDFVINARTDALAVGGMEEVVRRGNAYLAAGATCVFVDGMTSKELSRTAVQRINGPVAINVVEGGKSPERFTFSEMQEIGIARVSLPATLFLAASKAMADALEAVIADDCVGGERSRVTSFQEQTTLAGFDRVYELERKYLGHLATQGSRDR